MLYNIRVRDVATQKRIDYINTAIRNKNGEYTYDVGDILYKQIFGDEELIQVNGKDYTLLPIGNVRKGMYRYAETNEHIRVSSLNNSKIMSLTPITIPEASTDAIRESYIAHYKNVLGENWSNKDFDARLGSLQYCTYKYAKDEETGKIIVVGFFGALVATGAGGKYLTNAELYVLPQFRGKGIATELVKQSFDLALQDGITGFDSLTYRVPGFDSLKFWNNIGASTTELYHIAGDINEMVDNLTQIQEQTNTSGFHR